MSDPYNTYVDHVPASQATSIPIVSAAARQSAPMDLIGRLDVSETWKRRFRIIELAGGADLPKLRDLPSGDRVAVRFNFLAFFLGPFYYLAKGLWRQAVLYTLLAVAVGVLLELVGLGRAAKAIGYGVAAIYGIRANTSYYRKAVFGDAPWL